MVKKFVVVIAVLAACRMVAEGRMVTCLSGNGWTCDGAAVTVPHTWNAADASDGPRPEVVANPKLDNGGSAGGTGYLRKRAVYRRALPAPKAGRRAFLRFEGASIVADVFVNGERVGGHKGSFTAFGCEITRFLRPADNVLEVEVDNRRDFSTQPMSADYSVYGGLYRDVWLVETDPVCIDPIADGADGVKVNADAATGEVSVEVQVSGGTNEVQRFRVENHELWSPENPKLYTRTVRIAQKGSVDAVDVRFGFRTVEFRDGQFYLNGRKRQLRGVNRHQDRAGKGWAVSRADEEEDIRLIKEMGADALRTAHYPNSHHIYDLCDELGLVCWVEYPNVNRLTFTDEFEAGMRRQVREMIVQNRNHPCVAVWSMFNELGNGEGWMDWKAVVAMMGRTCDYVRGLDPTRRVTGVMGETGKRDLNVLPDEYGLNVYPKWYNARDMREMLDWVMAESGRKSVAITEYGVGASVSHHGDPAVAVPAGGGFHPEEYQAYRMHDNYLQMKRDARIWGTFVWAMYDFGADNRTEGDRFGINDKGIITHDRKTKKDVYWLYRANWTKDPVLHLVGSRMTSTTNGVLSVMGFSNVGAVSLTVNGKPFGERTPDDACGVLWPDVELKPGENRIELRSGDRTASAVWTLVSGGNG